MSRERLPPERAGVTRALRIPYVDDQCQPQVLKFWAQANAYEDGRLAEVFIHGDKIGDLVSGALDALACALSVALQHGVPMSELTSKLRFGRFGPNGFTGDASFPRCTSMFDLLAQWLEAKFPDGKRREVVP